MDKNFDFTTMELLLQRIEKDPDNMELKALINDLIMGSRKAGHLGLTMKEVIDKWGWKERIACTLIWPLAILTFIFSLINCCNIC